MFRTIVKCAVSSKKIDYDSQLMMLGSCFTEYLGAQLKRLKFNVVINPFGIVFHPAPIANNLERMISGKLYTCDELQLHNELWHSFDHHGRFSHPDPLVCLKRINDELQQAREQLARSELLFVTFGTAWAYILKATGQVASNCHKFPSSDFDRVRSDINEICSIWTNAIAKLRQLNPAVRVVFSVSPIRHLRDGAHENSLSKSILLLAVERLNREVENTDYFPAYEIVLDDLRDYRFFDQDMAHPNAVAVNYIWQRFCETFINDCERQKMKKVENIVKAAEHKPIHKSSEHRKFTEDCIIKIEELKRQMPFLDFSFEIEKIIDSGTLS